MLVSVEPLAFTCCSRRQLRRFSSPVSAMFCTSMTRSDGQLPTVSDDMLMAMFAIFVVSAVPSSSCFSIRAFTVRLLRMGMLYHSPMSSSQSAPLTIESRSVPESVIWHTVPASVRAPRTTV